MTLSYHPLQDTGPEGQYERAPPPLCVCGGGGVECVGVRVSLSFCKGAACYDIQCNFYKLRTLCT